MQVQDLYLINPLIKKKWQAFLTDCGITDFSENEVAKIDETIGIYDGETLVATGSIAGQVKLLNMSQYAKKVSQMVRDSILF